MKHALDVTSDFSHRELNRFLDLASLPEYVKTAQAMTKEATSTLDGEAFADRYHRAFPIDTAANAYISNAYYMNKRAELEDMWGKNYVTEVDSRIKMAAELFDISKDIESYNSTLNVKTAADYTEQCVSTVDGYELFPYKTAEDLSTQAQVFSKDLKNYPFDWRNKIASDFVEHAADLGVSELPDVILKYAGQYFPDTRNLATEFTRRMNKISSETAKSEYSKVLEKTASVESKDDAYNLCREAYLIEKKAGAYDNNSLSSQLGDVVDKTFTLDFQKIAELLNVIEMDGQPYNMSDLKKVSAEVYKEAFGCDIDPQNEAELRETLPVMPSSDIALWRELSGVRPV